MRNRSTWMISHDYAGWEGDISRLIYLEQGRQEGKLIEHVALERFLDKISRDAEFVVSYTDNKILGFSAFYTYDQSIDCSFITLFLVAPEARGKGVARSLLHEVAIDSFRKGFDYVTLHVRRDNITALRFYEKNGFIIEGGYGNQLHLKVSVRHFAE
ncbi:GNAT family N-acetyltransferase [Halomonas organivorans]